MNDSLPSGREIERAGRVLAENPQDEQALYILDLWRKHHINPLSRVINDVDKLCLNIDSYICVGRIKRTKSVIEKLQRPNSKFQLHTFDDLAAFRIIVPTIADVYQISQEVSKIYPEAKEKDYIICPRQPGYRSLHRICKLSAPPRDVRIELQIRTRRQHAFATLIEMYDYGYGSNIKSFSHDAIGKPENLGVIDSFEKISKAFHQLDEGKNPDKNLLHSLSEASKERIISVTRAYHDAANLLAEERQFSESRLLSLIRSQEQYIRVRSILSENLATELYDYNRLEAKGDDGVIVRLTNRGDLSIAYPLYTLDTSFIDEYLQELFA